MADNTNNANKHQFTKQKRLRMGMTNRRVLGSSSTTTTPSTTNSAITATTNSAITANTVVMAMSVISAIPQTLINTLSNSFNSTMTIASKFNDTRQLTNTLMDYEDCMGEEDEQALKELKFDEATNRPISKYTNKTTSTANLTNTTQSTNTVSTSAIQNLPVPTNPIHTNLQPRDLKSKLLTNPSLAPHPLYNKSLNPRILQNTTLDNLSSATTSFQDFSKPTLKNLTHKLTSHLHSLLYHHQRAHLFNTSLERKDIPFFLRPHLEVTESKRFEEDIEKRWRALFSDFQRGACSCLADHHTERVKSEETEVGYLKWTISNAIPNRDYVEKLTLDCRRKAVELLEGQHQHHTQKKTESHHKEREDRRHHRRSGHHHRK